LVGILNYVLYFKLFFSTIYYIQGDQKEMGHLIYAITLSKLEMGNEIK